MYLVVVNMLRSISNASEREFSFLTAPKKVGTPFELPQKYADRQRTQDYSPS